MLYETRKKIFTFQNIIIFASLIPIIIFSILIYINFKTQEVKNAFTYLTDLNKQEKKVALKYFKNLEFNANQLVSNVSFLEKQAEKNLLNIQYFQKNNLQKYYESVEKNLLTLSETDSYLNLYRLFEEKKYIKKESFRTLEMDRENFDIKSVLFLTSKSKIIYASDAKVLREKASVENLFIEFFKQLRHKKETTSVYFTPAMYLESLGEYKQYALVFLKDLDGYIVIEVDQTKIHNIINDVKITDKATTTHLYQEEDNLAYSVLAVNPPIATIKYKEEEKLGKSRFLNEGIDFEYGNLGNIKLVGYTPVKINNIVLSMQTSISYSEVMSSKLNGRDYFEQFIMNYGYKNIMLSDLCGDIFYSVSPDSKKKTNILGENYASPHLSESFKKILVKKKFIITDIGFAKDSKDVLSQFMLLPLFQHNGEVQSIAIIELKLNDLGNKFAQTSSPYDSYQTYLVGTDYKLRTNKINAQSRYTIAKSFSQNILVKSSILKQAFIKSNSKGFVQNAKQKTALCVVSTLSISGINWAIVSEIDKKEIGADTKDIEFNILYFILISSLVAFFIMLFITNQKDKYDKKIHYTATHDSLTGLPNRKFALEFLKYILANTKRSNKKGAVLFIDLDKFKIINDSYGHKVGDSILQEVAIRLQQSIRKEDLIARLGGDEFIVVMNNYENETDINTLCKKVIRSLSREIVDEQRRYQIGVSIGIATFPNDSEEEQELLQFADTAMFKTKENGRNGFTYYCPQMTEQSLKTAKIASELRQAIHKEELELYYQPQVNLKTSRVVSVEALVRWNHPQDGLILPDDFIPIAEESDLIIELGYWVTYEACKSFKKWKDDGIILGHISVNISARQLQSLKCIQKIQMIFEVLDFDPRWLEMEITEHNLISNMSSTVENIEILKSMGVRFAIDDFGTGYSSLSYLKSLQISTIKIDKKFIQDMIVSKDGRTIVEAIILMGHTLHYSIVAEGTQSKDEVELLKYFDCDIVQGFYHSKALQEKELIEYIEGFNT